MLELLADVMREENRPDGANTVLRGLARFDQIIVMDDGRGIIERRHSCRVLADRAIIGFKQRL